MRYKDKNFLKHSEKQRYGDYEYAQYASNRSIKRKERKENKKFYNKTLCNLVEKEWWDFLSHEDKKSIRGIYFYRSVGTGFRMCYFLESIKKDFKPDIKLLRSHRLKEILN